MTDDITTPARTIPAWANAEPLDPELLLEVALNLEAYDRAMDDRRVFYGLCREAALEFERLHASNDADYWYTHDHDFVLEVERFVDGFAERRDLS